VDECVRVRGMGDHVLRVGDCVVMVLHSDSGYIDLRDPVLEVQPWDPRGNEFCFDGAVMEAGRRYYVSYVVGKCSGGAVDLEDFCNRMRTVGVVFKGYPRPEAGEDRDVCLLRGWMGGERSIGEGRWEVIRKPGKDAEVRMADWTDPVSEVEVSEYGEYWFVWREDNGGCEAEDTVVYVFRGYPEVRLVGIECDDVSERYRVRYAVEGGDSSSVEAEMVGEGVVSRGWGEHVSEWAESGRGVRIVVRDRYGCEEGILDTVYECPCLTEVGELSGDLEMCAGEELRMRYVGGYMDGNDVVKYVLHDGDSAVIGRRLEENADGVFGYREGEIELNRRYWVTVLVGSDRGAGLDEGDRCLVWRSVPVVWYSSPEVEIEGGVLTCREDWIELDGGGSGVTSGVGGLRYRWEVVEGEVLRGEDMEGSTLRVVRGGRYRLRVENTYTGCWSEGEIEVEEDREAPEVEVVTLGCEGSEMRLEGRIGIPEESADLRWYAMDSWEELVRGELGVTVEESGWYLLRVEDRRNGCAGVDSVEVRLLDLYDGVVEDVRCYGERNGRIEVRNLRGGEGPYRVSLNGEWREYREPTVWRGLGAGVYRLRIEDSQGCWLEEELEIEEPEPVGVRARGDMLKEWGSSVALDTLIEEIWGVERDMADIRWYDEGGEEVGPYVDLWELGVQRYRVVLVDERGCAAEDEIVIVVKVERDVYVPNVIYPVGGLGGVNDGLYVYGRPELVDSVLEFRVYDRWGEEVWRLEGGCGFDERGRSEAGWDGRLHGRGMNPGVYVYYVVVRFKDLGDGSQPIKTLYGDFTLIR